MLHGNRCVTFFMIVINRLFISNCNFIKYIMNYWEIVITESKHIENISLNEMDGEGSLSFWFSISNYKICFEISFVCQPRGSCFVLFFLWIRRFQRFRTGMVTVSDFLLWFHKVQLGWNKIIAKFLSRSISVKVPQKNWGLTIKAL